MDAMITWEKRKEGTAFYDHACYIGLAEACDECEDTFELEEHGAIMWKRICTTDRKEMTMRFIREGAAEYVMAPGLFYNGNNFGDKLDYTGLKDEKSGRPWRWLWHRTTIAGATVSEGRGTYTAMYLPREQQDASCSVYPTEKGSVHELLWPMQEGPRVYRQKYEWIEEYKLPMKPRREFCAWLLIGKEDALYDGCHNLIRCAWTTEKRTIRRWYSDEDLWRMGLLYAESLFDREPDGFCGFSIGNEWVNGAYRHRDNQKYEIGWCGQNASLAVSLLAQAEYTGDEIACKMALKVLDSWIAAEGPTGLLPTHYDDNMYTQGFPKTVDACNLGTAAMQFFEAHERCLRLGIERDAYRSAALTICDFAVEKMTKEGRIGKSWVQSDLKPAVVEGTVGAFLTLALCEGARRTENERYLDAAKRSMRYYIAELRDHGFTTAGALDIYCVDKESSIPLLKSGIMLYELTGEEEWLKMAVDAAYYLSTWQVLFTREYPKDSPLGEMGFDTFGGTVVSTTHLSIDHFALCYADDLRSLSKLTGDRMWEERAEAIWLNGQQGISDGTLRVDGKLRPVGSQDEGLQYTFWSELNCPTWWLVAWPTAFRLESIRHRKNEGCDKR